MGQIVQTVHLTELARNVGNYTGQTVRVCGGRWRGSMTRPDGTHRGWILSKVDPSGPRGPHVTSVYVACRTPRPRLVDGCLTGRIAREDGSQTPSETVTVSSHVTASREWWLHPQCGRS